MPQIAANGIQLEYVSYGPESGEAVLLIMGLGAQMTRWPLPLIQQLVAKGYRVVTFDNRDVGLSQRFDAAGAVDLGALMGARMAGKPFAVPYTLDDMANDAVGLLDALQIEHAHVVGVSMGGMIAQLIAIKHPHKAASIVSMMSTSGAPGLPPARPEVIAAVAAPLPADDFKATVEHTVRTLQLISGPAYPPDPQMIKRQAIADLNRSSSPQGPNRQLAAVASAGDRRALLKTIAVPAVVIHGVDDPLIPVEHGRDTARHIPGAELIEFAGMGHDLPAPLFAAFVEAIDRAAARARR